MVRLLQAELEAAKKFLYQEMGYRSRSEQLTKTSEINLDYQEVVRYPQSSSSHPHHDPTLFNHYHYYFCCCDGLCV